VNVSFSGLTEGSHTIEAKTYSSGSVVDEESVSFSVLKPMSQSEKDSLDNQISSLQSTVNTLNSNTATMQAEISVLENTLAQKEDEISSLKQKNSEFLNDMAQLEYNISELESSGATNEEILMNVKDDLNVLLTERAESQKNPLSGFFAFGASNSTLLLALIAIIAIIVIGVFLKKNSSSIYSSSIFSRNDDLVIPTEENVVYPKTKSFEKETNSSLGEKESKTKGFFSKFRKEKTVESEEKKRKWATESYHPAEKVKDKDDSKRFELGDLIRK